MLVEHVIIEEGNINIVEKFPSNKYDMYAVATGLSLAQARAMEQTIITAYGIDTLKNMINSISPKNGAI